MDRAFTANGRLRPNRKTTERHYRELRFLYSDFVGNTPMNLAEQKRLDDSTISPISSNSMMRRHEL